MPISSYLRKLRSKIGNDEIMMPAVTAIIVNEAGEILLHQASDNLQWYAIGGSADPGEAPARAAVRETLEETGLIVRPERLVGVYADPLRVYPNGDAVMYTASCFLCRPIGGVLSVADDESLDVRYFAPGLLPAMDPSQRLKIDHALAGVGGGYFDWNDEWLKNL